MVQDFLQSQGLTCRMGASRKEDSRRSGRYSANDRLFPFRSQQGKVRQWNSSRIRSRLLGPRQILHLPSSKCICSHQLYCKHRNARVPIKRQKSRQTLPAGTSRAQIHNGLRLLLLRRAQLNNTVRKDESSCSAAVTTTETSQSYAEYTCVQQRGEYLHQQHARSNIRSRQHHCPSRPCGLQQEVRGSWRWWMWQDLLVDQL